MISWYTYFCNEWLKHFFDPLQNSSAPSAEDIDPEVPLPSKSISDLALLHVKLTDCVTFLQLARYLNRTYWEKKQEEARKSPTPSAPAPVPLAEPVPAISQPVEGHVPVQPVNIVEV